MNETSGHGGAYRSPHGIEQSRRDFMRDHPDLYRYIALRESEKALKSAADAAGGAADNFGAANRIYAMQGRTRDQHERMRSAARDEQAVSE